MDDHIDESGGDRFAVERWENEGGRAERDLLTRDERAVAEGEGRAPAGHVAAGLTVTSPPEFT